MIARENPFCISRVLKVRYEPQNTTWHQLLERLRLLHYRAAIIGPEGSGKTTLLEDLAGNLSRQFSIQWFSLSEDSSIPSFREIQAPDLVMVDGADLLGFLNFQKLVWKKTAGLIVTAHRPTSLPTLLECSTSPELLTRIQQRLIGQEANHKLSQQLFEKHRGNLRHALLELYDICAMQRRL